MAAAAKTSRQLTIALAFLAPNILGFLAFTLLPLFFSLVMAFSNWDLRLHGMFKHEPLRFIGLQNFRRLLNEPDFWLFLGNTLYLMIGIPFCIAGSLLLAMLLSKDLLGGQRRVPFKAMLAIWLIASIIPVALFGIGVSGLPILLSGVSCAILLAGMLCGSSVYRAMYYLPHFISGVATILLCKNLFNPRMGPINAALSPVLNVVAKITNAMPEIVVKSGLWICVALTVLLITWGLRHLTRKWSDGEIGGVSLATSALCLLLPVILSWSWMPTSAATALTVVACALTFYNASVAFAGREFSCSATEALGGAMLLSMGLLVLEFMLIGLAQVFWNLPAMARAGLHPPGWHTDYHWAKPTLIMIVFWSSVGSNNMLLYLAGLSGVPVELYEAANIDGATGLQRFWNVTWPQLVPTTFFILVMSVIGGLQGGFEMARAMTQGGPDGATTTLSYFIYNEGFVTGRLGYSSAVAWTLFLLVMLVTAVNWKVGSRYAND